MSLPRLLLVAALAAVVAPLPAADETLPAGAKVATLDVRPTAIDLTGPFTYSQLVVNAKLESGETVDATRIAKIEVPASLKLSPTGIVRPIADGKGELTVTLGGATAKVPVAVSGQKSDTSVSFVKDVQPVLSKLGCNQGTCHGSAQGKNGFKLSLRGYDPIYDHRSLTDDLEGRRFNRAAPERSLMLLKTAGAVPHVGGVLTSPGEPYYELLKQWISAGVKQDLSAPRVASIDLFPKDPTINRIGSKQQFAVIATYTDGTKRDVSAEAFVDSSNTDIATVDKTGLVTTVRRGEATMLARYEGSYAASTVVVMGDRTGFAWEQRPVNNWVDELVDAKLKKVQVQASPLCDDSEFIRRVYIDLTGLPPTSDEVRKFLDDKRETKLKRDEVVDKLVGSEAFIEHWSNKWADLLQVNRKFLGGPGADALRKWIRDAVAKNMPYDKFAYEVLTASGSNVENPPAAYYKVLRDADGVMENTTQLFLAIRFNCNKCHDHPFERWTQDQYYYLAAYFSQVGRTEDPKYKGQKLGGTAVEGAKPLVELITDVKSGEIKHDRTGQVAPPKFPFEVPVSTAATEPRRVQVAKWITSPANPYFAKSYANRLWSYLLGVGIIEPIDDIRAGNPATNPELLNRLTKEFVDSGFDTQQLIKTICKSRTYQLSIATNKWNKDDEINYARALPRRLSAEVLFDSIHRATGSVSRLPGLPAGARAAQLPDSNVELPGGFLDLFGKPVRESACECERSNTMMLGPVLALVNGPVIGDAVKDPNGHLSKFAMGNTDDKKVVEEIYLSVLNRFPTASEAENGIKAIRAAGPDHKRLVDQYDAKVAAFEAYKKNLDALQKAWEDQQRALKPTEWTVLTPTKAESKSGPTLATAKGGATLSIGKDNAILASGKIDPVDVYTVDTEVKLKGAITALRLEVLTDPSLPAKGPGRAENGNFVLSEFSVASRPLAKSDEKPKPVKLVRPMATIEQPNFPVKNALDGNRATGWAVFGGIGKDQEAVFNFDKSIDAKDGVALSVTLHHEFGTGHMVGKFRLSVTTDKNPKFGLPIPKDLAKLLETPVDQRTEADKKALRDRYLATDREYQRLAGEASQAPPSDARVLGAQDLVWALLNSPAFLFNH